jgi:glycine betaine catabolism A
MTAFVKAGVPSGARTLEARWYCDDEVFAAERERIFATDWVCVGREESLATTGDYFVATVADESLIVVRDGDGALHAFYNVCRHRGTRMCETSNGKFHGSIQCPYHAWTYALDGRLMVARNMSEVPGFREADYPLREAALATWDGFVFVNLAPAPTPFAQAYAPLLHRFAKWNVGSLRTAHTLTYTVACNWKLVFQNYSECYHCPLVHPQLEKLSPSDSGRNDLAEGPFLGGYSDLRENASLTATGTTKRPPLPGVDSADMHRAYYYTLFPSMMLSLHADYAMVHYVRPLSTGWTEIECAFLFDPATMARADFDPGDAVDFWDTTNRQDWHVSELTYKGIGSRRYAPGPYANAEGLLAAFDRHYLEIMNAH